MKLFGWTDRNKHYLPLLFLISFHNFFFSEKKIFGRANRTNTWRKRDKKKKEFSGFKQNEKNWIFYSALKRSLLFSLCIRSFCVTLWHLHRPFGLNKWKENKKYQNKHCRSDDERNVNCILMWINERDRNTENKEERKAFQTDRNKNNLLQRLNYLLSVIKRNREQRERRRRRHEIDLVSLWQTFKQKQNQLCRCVLVNYKYKKIVLSREQNIRIFRFE